MAVLCPLCESGSLTEILVDEVMRYQGEELRVPGVAISECQACGAQLAQPHQIRANERVFADAKRTRDGLLRSQEIAELRHILGLSQQQAAAMFGGGQNAFSKYERGEVLQSRPMDLLLRTAGHSIAAARFLAVRAGIDLRNAEWETLAGQRSVKEHLGNIETKMTPINVRRISGAAAGANEGVWRDEPSEAAHG